MICTTCEEILLKSTSYAVLDPLYFRINILIPFYGQSPIKKEPTGSWFTVLFLFHSHSRPAPALNNNLGKQPEWIRDETGRITGYKFGGADSVFPFSNVERGSFNIQAGHSLDVDLGGKPKFVSLVALSTTSKYGFWTNYSSKLGHVFDAYDLDGPSLIITDTGFRYTHPAWSGAYTIYYCFSLTNDAFVE